MVPEVDRSAVADRLGVINDRIVAAGGELGRITIVAVTKGFGDDAVRAAIGVGLLDIGENYATELLAKQAEAASSVGPDMAPRWHYLGAVQRNKVARLAPVVTCWQSVSRAEEALAIAKRTEGHSPEVFVEVDLSGAAGRGGCSEAEAPSVVAAARQGGCNVRGLMTVAPLGSPQLPDTARKELAAEAFGKVARLASSLQLDELSMGMSHDLEQAVAAGSTMVRIGTALFGERASR